MDRLLHIKSAKAMRRHGPTEWLLGWASSSQCVSSRVTRVNQINAERLAHLDPRGPAEWRIPADDQGDLQELSGCNWPKMLELKVGAQVMLLKNLDVKRKLVNGSMGIVERVCLGDKNGGCGGGEVGGESAAAVASQDSSRGKPYIEVRFDGFMERIEAATHDVVATAHTVKDTGEADLDYGDTTSERIIASRTQFPLRLAWAMTIHKSQGQL